MNGKKTVKKTAIALLCASFAAAATGCDSMIKTDNEADMSRVVATVDITKNINRWWKRATAIFISAISFPHSFLRDIRPYRTGRRTKIRSIS